MCKCADMLILGREFDQELSVNFYSTSNSYPQTIWRQQFPSFFFQGGVPKGWGGFDITYMQKTLFLLVLA